MTAVKLGWQTGGQTDRKTQCPTDRHVTDNEAKQSVALHRITTTVTQSWTTNHTKQAVAMVPDQPHFVLAGFCQLSLITNFLGNLHH